MQAAYNVGLAHFSVEQNTREGLLKSLHEAQAVTAIISIPLLASLAAASTPLTLLLLGDKWAPVSVLMLGPIAVSFLSIRRMFPTTMLRATGRSGISLIATVVEGVTIFAMLAIYGASSPFAFNIAYPFGIMVGSIPIFWLLAEEFKASSNEQLLLFGRDLAVGLLAFFAGLLTVKQLGHESYLLQLTMGGGVAFLIAGVSLVTMNARLLMKLLGKMESMTSKPETLSAVFPAAAAHDSKSAAAVNTKHRGRGKARFRATGARIFRQVDAMLPRARMIDSNIRRLVYFKAHGRWPLRPSDMQATFNDFVFQKMSHDSWSLLERVCIDKQFAKLMARALCPDVLTARTEDVLLLSKFNAMEGLISSLRRFTERSRVAKSTHGSGAVLFMRSCVSDSELEAFCIAGSQSYYHSSRESQYKCLEHKIIIEEYLSSGNHPLTDYKFFCASGQVLFCQIDVGRFVDHRRMLVTPSFDKIDVNYTYAAPDVPPRRPTNFAAMLVVAQQLSAPFDFVRVDLYSIGEKVYFGEFTFAPEGGAGRLSDETFGIWVMGQIRQRKTLMEDTAYDRAWRRNAWC